MTDEINNQPGQDEPSQPEESGQAGDKDDETLVIDFEDPGDEPAQFGPELTAEGQTATPPPSPTVLPIPSVPPIPAVPATPTKPPSPDTLVIDLDAEEPEPKAYSPKPAGGIEITMDDLSDEPPPGSLPPVGSPGPVSKDIHEKQGVAGTLSSISYSGLIILALGGLIGGLIGWVITEPMLRLADRDTLLLSQLAEAIFYAALVGAAIGLALGIANAIKTGSMRKMLDWAITGLCFGLFGGIFGGGLAQYIYGTVDDAYILSSVGEVTMRAVGWSMLGVFFGLGQAAVVTADKKMRNGIIGGAVGGLIGGIAFQLIKNGAIEPAIGRLLALCTMGLAIGLLIAFVEEVAKEAWLRITAGPLTGKQFILYEDRTTIGSAPECSIVLFKDPQVAPQHAAINNERTEYLLECLVPGATVLVNGGPVRQRSLTDGDVITIGKTDFEFRERARSEKPTS